MRQYATTRFRAAAIALLLTPSLATADLLSFVEPQPADPAATTPALPPDRLDPQWTVQFEPVAWFVAPSGDIRLAVSSGSGPSNFTTAGDSMSINDLNLDTTRLRPAGEVHIGSGRWRFTFAGFDYSADHSDLTVNAPGRLGSVELAAGDRIRAQFDFASYQLTAGYRVWGYDFLARSSEPANAVDAILNVYAIGGARLYDLGIDIERLSGTSASAGADHTFVEPIVGVRAEAEIDKAFSLDVELTFGALPLDETSSLSLDVAAGFTWRPVPNVGVQIGYRQLAFDLEDGDGADQFEYTGRLAGLFVGVTIRF